MTIRLALGLVTCAIALVGQASAQTPDSGFVKVVRSSADAVLLIETFDELGRPLATGTGFFVDSSGTMVTNHHVLLGAVTARALTRNREPIPILGWISVNPDADLLVLRTQTSSPTPWLRLGGPASPEPGTELVVIGSPRGLAQTVTTGTSSGLQDLGGRRMLQLSALASPGSSGSPVLDGSARVRGIVSAVRQDALQVVYAVPSSDLSALLVGQDSVKALAALPTGATAMPRRRDDPFAAPAGMTGMYRFQTLTGFPFAYVWVVEAPTGQLTGAAFTLHPTGFVDVVPVQTGARPGRRRAFDLRIGCALLEGWIRDQGILSGDVGNGCRDGSPTPFVAAPIQSSDEPTKRRAIRRYLAQASSPSSSGKPSSTWAWVVAVTPRDLGEGTVGSLHMWGDILGRPGRLDLTFGRGRSDTTSLTLLTTDESTTLSVKESNGTIDGKLFTTADPSQGVSLRGYREEYAYCFNEHDIRTSADSVLASLSMSDKLLDDSLRTLNRIATSAGLAAPRQEPLGGASNTRIDEKERVRLLRRAPIDSAIGRVVATRGANARLRIAAHDRLASLTKCPHFPQEPDK